MTRLNELRQKRIEASAAHRALLDAHLKAANGERGFTAEEKTAQAAAEAKVTQLDELIAAEERRIELEKQAAITSAPAVAAVSERVEVVQDNAIERPWAAGRRGLGQFAIAVLQAHTGSGIDPRLYKAAGTGLNEALGPDGGFAVPVEQATAIEKEMFEQGEILSRVDARDIIGNAITYPVMREISRADGSRRGGVLGYWIDEGGAPDPTKIQLDKLEMKLRKVAALGYVTEELLADAAALAAELQLAFVDELIFQVEDKVFRGKGAGAPRGFMESPCLITVTAETGQATATIVNDNILKMWIRMRPRDRANAVWLCNPEIEPQLDQLALPVGTAALEPRYVMYGPDGVLRIKGRPVVFCEYSEALGTAGDIALVNLAKYRLIRKGGVEQSSSIHVRFTQGETAFRAFYRVDGQAVPRAAITPYKGSATTSPFVVLATR